MIPMPPFDSALPGLATLLDGHAMAALLAERWPAVTGCAPAYLRYKPGTSATVQYDVSATGANGAPSTIQVHCTAFADGGAERHLRSGRLRRIVERSVPESVDGAPAGAVLLGGMRALVQVYPVDYDLKALARLADHQGMGKVLRRCLPGNAGTIAGDPELVRYKAGRKALLRCSLAGGQWDQVYARVHADGRGRWPREVSIAARQAGLPTPAAIGHDHRTGLLVHESCPGDSLASLPRDDAYAGLMPEAAHLLTRLHAVEVPGLPVRTTADAAGEVARLARWLGTILPGQEARLASLAGRIGQALVAAPPAVATCHGDYYDDQVLVSANGLVVLDLDRTHQGHSLGDVGTMLAHLAEAPAARGAFLEAALANLPALATADLAPFEAAGLLRLAPAPFRALRADWPEAVEQIVSRVEACLVSPRLTGGSRLEGTHVVVDPQLPQLAAIQDPIHMGDVLIRAGLGHVLPDAPPTVVRHKPGRRAIVRFAVENAGQAFTLYGKTFASERGPTVFAVSRAIAEGTAFGPEIAVPEPVAYVPELKLAVQRAVAGEPVTSLLMAGNGGIAVRIADAISRLHRSGIDLGRRHDLTRELSPLEGRVADLATVSTEVHELGRRVLDQVRAQVPGNVPWRWCPVHRDFYHDQVLIDGERLAILDLDDAAMSEPAVDVANFAAHLRLLRIQQPASSASVDVVRKSFVARVMTLDPDLDQRLVTCLEAATLLRLAGIHGPRRDGERIAASLLAESRDVLDGLAGD